MKPYIIITLAFEVVEEKTYPGNQFW